jgi:hypothetical protein
MEHDELKPDDLLGRLMNLTATETPSEGFAGKVMEGIHSVPETVPVKRPFYLFLKRSWGWFLLGIFSMAILFITDFSFLDFLPGRQYFAGQMPYYDSLLQGLKHFFPGSKAVTMALFLVFACGLLYGLDQLIHKRMSMRHHVA